MTDGPGPRRQARSTVTVSAIAALGIVLSACGSGGDSDALKPARPTTTATGFAITESQRDFHLSFRIEQPGKTIRVTDVQALTSPNVQYLGAVTVWPRDLPGENMGFGLKYPPPKAKAVHQLSEEIPAAETLVVPKPFSKPPAVYVVTGFRLVSGDIGAMNGVRVSYMADGRKSADTWPVAGIACLKPKNCEGPEGSDSADFESRTLRELGLLPKD